MLAYLNIYALQYQILFDLDKTHLERFIIGFLFLKSNLIYLDIK